MGRWWIGSLVVALVASVGSQSPTPSLFRIVQNGKFGYIDRSGHVVIAARFDRAEQFSDGVAWTSRAGKPGFIDSTGTLLFELDHAAYDTAEAYVEGRSLVARLIPYGDVERRRVGFIDKGGKLVIPMQFDGGQSFSEGLAVVSVRGKSGYIDRSGRFVIQPTYVLASRFSGGVARVGEMSQGLRQEHYINSSGPLAGT